MPAASYPVSGLPLSFCIFALGRDVIAITSVGGRNLEYLRTVPGSMRAKKNGGHGNDRPTY
jgi:hypothetical protein